MRDKRISLAVARIPRQNTAYPWGVRLVIQPVDGSVDGHGVERIGRNGERLIGLLGGTSRFVIFEREARQEHTGLRQLGIGDKRLLRELDGLAFEVLSGNQGQAEQRARVIFLDLERFFKQLGGFGAVEPFEEQPAPTNPVIRIFRMRGHQGTELGAGGFVLLLLPERFGPLQGLGMKREQANHRRDAQAQRSA